MKYMCTEYNAHVQHGGHTKTVRRAAFQPQPKKKGDCGGSNVYSVYSIECVLLR